jgi:DNA gyrase subunit A
VIRLIRASRTDAEAKEGLMANFGLTDRQAQAILDMRLRRLTGLEREKIEAEYNELLTLIAHLKDVLANEWMLLGIIKEELLEIKRKYADPRRTEITALDGEIDMLDLIQEEDMVVTLTHYGYVKRLPKATYRAQKRGGKGITGATTREEDFVEQLYVTSTHDPIMFFTSRGRVYEKRCYEIPEAGRTARGTAIVNLLQLDGGEKVTAMLPVPEEKVAGHYLIMATKNGLIKRTELSEFQNLRKNGLIALVLREDDDLIAVALTDGEREVLLGTEQGMAIRFAESDMRPIGRAAMGVKSIDLDEGDRVVAMSILEEGAQVLSLTQLGYGKRTEIDEYRVQSRAGKGIKAMNLTDKTGFLAGQLLVHEDEDLLLITDDGIIIRTPVSAISVQGRNTQGVRIMRVEEGARVVCVARAEPEDEEDDVEVLEDAASCAPDSCPNALDVTAEAAKADLDNDREAPAKAPEDDEV